MPNKDDEPDWARKDFFAIYILGEPLGSPILIGSERATQRTALPL